jgi:hypothetical protein
MITIFSDEAKFAREIRGPSTREDLVATVTKFTTTTL